MNTTKSRVVEDRRFGPRPMAMLILAGGVGIFSYTIYGILSIGFLPADSFGISVFWVCVLLVLTILTIGACRLMWQSRCIVHRIENRNEVVIVPFLSSRHRYAIEDLQDVERYSRYRPWTLLSLLSWDKDNFCLHFSDGRSFWLNGEIPGAEEFVADLMESAGREKTRNERN